MNYSNLNKNLQRLENFARSLYPKTRQDLTCPSCKTTYTEPDEVEFLQENPMCWNCEDAWNDVQMDMAYQAKMEAQDQIEAAADTMGISVEDYMEAME